MEKLFEIKEFKGFKYICMLRPLEIYDFKVTTRSDSNALFFITEEEWKVDLEVRGQYAKLGLILKEELTEELIKNGFDSLLFSGENSAWEHTEEQSEEKFKEVLETKTEEAKKLLLKKAKESIELGIKTYNSCYTQQVAGYLFMYPTDEMKQYFMLAFQNLSVKNQEELKILVEDIKYKSILAFIKDSKELEDKEEIVRLVNKKYEILKRFL